MKQFLILFALILTFNSKADVIVHGRCYKAGIPITFYRYDEFLTNTEIQIGQTIVNPNGSFNVGIRTNQIEKILLRYDKKYCWMYVQPDATYYIDLLNDDSIKTNFSDDNESELVFLRLDSTDINYKVLAFEAWMDDFLADIYLLKDVKPGEFARGISIMKKEIARDYASDTNSYFGAYLKYSVGLTVDNFQYIGSMTQAEKYEFYFLDSPLLVQNDKYMEFFQLFFEKYYYQLSKEIRAEAYSAVIRSDLDGFLVALNKDPMLKDTPLVDLVALLIFKEEMNSKELPKSNLKVMLTHLEADMPEPTMKRMAQNLLKKYAELQAGMKSPDFLLDENIHLSDYTGKYIYLHFFNPENQKCINEISALRKLYEKYGKYIEIISIIPYDGQTLGEMEIRNLEAIKWSRFGISKEHEIWSLLKVKNYPYYILIDEQLIIKSMPALTPSPNGLYETIEKTFYDIKRKKENN